MKEFFKSIYERKLYQSIPALIKSKDKKKVFIHTFL